MPFTDAVNPGNPPGNTDVWYFATNGVRAGPFSRAQIEEMWSVGAVSSESLVWAVGMRDWIPAYEIFGMEEAASQDEIRLAGGFNPGATAIPAPTTGPMLNYHRLSARELIHPAGFWRRFLAWLIDYIIWRIVQYAIVWRLFMALSGQFGSFVTVTPVRSSTAAGRAVVVNGAMNYYLIYLVLIYVIYYGYFAIMEATPWQATIGKRLVGIRVTDDSGRRLPLIRTVIRQLCSLLNLLTLGLTYLTVAFSKDKVAIHDMMNHTKVVCGRTGSNGI